MMKYVYTVWLVDESLPVDDPERDWPACFVIEGQTDRSALNWGDSLAKNYAARTRQRVNRSHVESAATSDLPGIDGLPVIAEGHEATDAEIGW